MAIFNYDITGRGSSFGRGPFFEYRRRFNRGSISPDDTFVITDDNGRNWTAKIEDVNWREHRHQFSITISTPVAGNVYNPATDPLPGGFTWHGVRFGDMYVGTINFPGLTGPSIVGEDFILEFQWDGRSGSGDTLAPGVGPNRLSFSDSPIYLPLYQGVSSPVRSPTTVSQIEFDSSGFVSTHTSGDAGGHGARTDLTGTDVPVTVRSARGSEVVTVPRIVLSTTLVHFETSSASIGAISGFNFDAKNWPFDAPMAPRYFQLTNNGYREVKPRNAVAAPTWFQDNIVVPGATFFNDNLSGNIIITFDGSAPVVYLSLYSGVSDTTSYVSLYSGVSELPGHYVSLYSDYSELPQRYLSLYSGVSEFPPDYRSLYSGVSDLATYRQLYDGVSELPGAYRSLYDGVSNLHGYRQLYDGVSPVERTGYQQLYSGVSDVNPNILVPTANWELLRYNQLAWTNINQHIATVGIHREGRDPASLGGGSPIGGISSMSVGLVGISVNPGDQLRCSYGDPQRLRFRGGMLSSQAADFGFQTEWLGGLWALTADLDPNSILHVGRTPAQILADIARVAEVNTKTLGKLDTRFTRVVPYGIDGLETLEEMAGAFARDDVDLNVVLEFPSYRQDMAVKRKVTPEAKVVRHLNAFGVINHVDVIYRLFFPTADGEVTQAIAIPDGTLSVPTVASSERERITIPTDLLFDASATATLALQFSFDGNKIGDAVEEKPSTRTAIIRESGQVLTVTVNVSNFNVELRGDVIIIDFDYTASANARGVGLINANIDVGGTVTVTNPRGLTRDSFDYHYPVEDASSKRQYRRRTYPNPVIVGRLLTGHPDQFVPGPIVVGNLVNLGRQIIRGKQAKPVYETVTPDIDLISNREISDREVFPYYDEDEVKHDIDGHLEAYENQIGSPFVQRTWHVPREFAIGVPHAI